MGYGNFNLSEVGRKFHDEKWGVLVHDETETEGTDPLGRRRSHETRAQWRRVCPHQCLKVKFEVHFGIWFSADTVSDGSYDTSMVIIGWSKAGGVASIRNFY